MSACTYLVPRYAWEGSKHNLPRDLDSILTLIHTVVDHGPRSPNPTSLVVRTAYYASPCYSDKVRAEMATPALLLRPGCFLSANPLFWPRSFLCVCGFNCTRRLLYFVAHSLLMLHPGLGEHGLFRRQKVRMIFCILHEEAISVVTKVLFMSIFLLIFLVCVSSDCS